MSRPAAAEVRLARAWLSRAVEPGRPALYEFVSAVGPVEAVRRLRAGSAGDEVAALAEARRAQDRAADDLAEAARLGARLVTPEDDEWPDEALRPIEIAFAREQAARRAQVLLDRDQVAMVPPLALWVVGGVRVDEALARAVAVVGSRTATPYGEHVAADLGHGLAGRRWTVVSGGAYGIDGAAHRGALAGSGLTVAVVAGGLAAPYPRGHAALFARIARDGLLMSEWPPDATPQRHRFLVRNRLIAALTAGTVVVEAGVRSGALATGRQALRVGRAVMAVPGPVTSAESAGVNRFLQDNAEVRLVTRAADVVEMVGVIGEDLAPRDPAPPAPRDGLDPIALQVLDGLPTSGTASPDRIAVAAGVPPLDVLRCLPGLEARGLVDATPSGWCLTAAARGAGTR
ncbi:MAG TPA: DNA-processing protein DprA [Mycobacteriales bacterium]|nr:DNA-processing protein DprA [Mycobacteriales bacterium]